MREQKKERSQKTKEGGEKRGQSASETSPDGDEDHIEVQGVFTVTDWNCSSQVTHYKHPSKLVFHNNRN